LIRSRRGRLPANIRFQADRPLAGRRVFLSVLIGVIVVLLGIMGLLWKIQDHTIHAGNLLGILEIFSPSQTLLHSMTSISPFTDTPVLATSQLPTLRMPSLTVSPTFTLSPTPQTPSATLPLPATATRTIYFIPTRTPTRTFTFPKDMLVDPTAFPTATVIPTG